MKIDFQSFARLEIVPDKEPVILTDLSQELVRLATDIDYSDVMRYDKFLLPFLFSS